MFFIIAIGMLWIMHGYVAWRFIPALGFSSSQTILAYTAVFILSLLPILPIALRMSGNESKIIDRLSLVGYTSLGFFTLSFIIFTAKDFILQLYPLIEGLFHTKEPLDYSKRDFIKKSVSIAMIGIAGTGTGFGFYSSRKGPTVMNQDIFLESLPDGFENFTIVQISDLHVRPTIKRPYVEDVFRKIAFRSPDLIVVTGDLVDGSVDYLSPEIEPLKDLIAPYGTYFVTGNHEYYSGVDPWLDETDRLGMKNLINTNEIISKSGDEIAIAGITDLNAHQINLSHRSDPELALASLPKDIIKIVLAHQPNSIHAVHKVGADLQLSGHTHGGQFWPFTYPVKIASTYIAGYYDHFGTQIYVNRGTGYWGPPLRIGVPAEITLIRLKKKVVS
ncbi:MAG TPA: metallophosphoesterase [Candidatus Marinimicrobia bacterium]|nr:metallophosphoesterase [Candidatus Neomarinimicrobiota bacterium]